MMKAFKNFTGLVAPLDRPNVDTDQIIPKQFLKAVVRSGLAKGLFFDWRNQPDSQFVLNQPRFEKATILVARANFGCGSSREHAVWALADFGFHAIIAPSFADIFKNNCLKNGILTIVLKPAETDAIFNAIKERQDYHLTIDLPAQKVADEFGWSAHFDIDPFPKRCLIEGLDDIALTLMQDEKIKSHEAAHPVPYKF
ncbi:MAG: 3-isopropylmalate/(R)-2-methylmalate dehydratase small subunit [Candidatus Binataceae bacterium]|nr:3-isopropylmalate/(R)-2-methylmalate dehydratase small subunit [Candidatus Binataceae bacterium]